jgi:hypothetical protein
LQLELGYQQHDHFRAASIFDDHDYDLARHDLDNCYELDNDDDISQFPGVWSAQQISVR